jgi:hypothetical protein
VYVVEFTLFVTVTPVAPLAVTVSVLDCPLVMDVGLADMLTVGLPPVPLTVTVTEALALFLLPFAVAV